MPLPAALTSLVSSPRFWSDFFWDTETHGEDERPYRELDGLRLEFPASRQRGLTFDFSEYLIGLNLGLRRLGNSEPDIVAVDDEPYALQWNELELLARCIALADPEMPHPGLTLCLLSRFAPICVGDDVSVIFPMLDAAWRRLNIFDDATIDEYVERFDRRQDCFHWQTVDGLGEILTQDEEAAKHSVFTPYTFRCVEHDSFPFADWNTMIADAEQTYRGAIAPEWLNANDNAARSLAEQIVETHDLSAAPRVADALAEAGCAHPTILNALRLPDDPTQTCWVLELLLGMKQGAFIRAHFGSTIRRQRVLYHFAIRIPTSTREYALPTGWNREFVARLDAALRSQNLGRAKITSYFHSGTLEGQIIEAGTDYLATVYDDMERGIEVIRETLHAYHAPTSTPLRLKSPQRHAIPIVANGDEK